MNTENLIGGRGECPHCKQMVNNVSYHRERECENRPAMGEANYAELNHIQRELQATADSMRGLINACMDNGDHALANEVHSIRVTLIQRRSAIEAMIQKKLQVGDLPASRGQACPGLAGQRESLLGAATQGNNESHGR